ncbi:MAG: hypothetical protein Q4E35_07990 [Eubacteriales bacterium]|nr:hypothetical protein [Eubacteriales bacterium]
MLNRYQGNTGKVERIDDSPSAPYRTPPPTRPSPVRSEPAAGLLEGIGKLLQGGGERLDSEDIILLLILYLMYRESGDTELLIIMAAMYLL